MSTSIAPKILNEFAIVCIRTQLNIAKNVRAVQNRPYVLYDKHFHKTAIVNVKSYRVQRDAHNRYGILSEAAQKTFGPDDYVLVLEHANNGIFHKDEIVFCDGSFVLQPIPKEVFVNP